MFNKKPKYISLKEAAKLTGYAPDYIGSLIRMKKIPGKKVYSGVSWMIVEEDLKEYQQKTDAQKLKTNKKWKAFKFISDNLTSVNIPIQIKETAKKIAGIRQYKNKREKIFSFSWRFLLIIIVSIFFIGGSPLEIWRKIVGALTGEEKTINFYSTTCIGEWQNPQNVQGQPEAGELGDLNSFSESNSAVYKGGPLSLLCQDFEKSSEQLSEEELKNLKIQSAKIKFSFAIGEIKPDLEINQVPIPEEPEPPIEEPLTPTEEPTTPPEEPIAPIEVKEPPVDEQLVPNEGQSPLEIPQAPAEEPEAPIEEPLVPSEEPGVIEITPETILPLELMNGSFSKIPSSEKNEQPTGFVNKIKNLFALQNFAKQNLGGFGTLTVQAEEEIPSTETVSPSEEATSNQQQETSEPETENLPLTEVTEDRPLSAEEVITPNLDSKIIIWYSFDNETWWKLTTISDYPSSNFSNNGYFSFDAPFLKNSEDLKNLKIKFEGVVGGETTVIAYLDSVWVDVIYESEKKNEPQTDDSEVKLKEIKKIKIKDNLLIIPNLENNFSINDEPSFVVSEPEINTEDIISGGKGRLISGVEAVQEIYGTGGELIPSEFYLLASLESSSQELISSSKKKNQKDSISVQVFGFDGLKADILPEIQPIFKDGKESFEIKFTKEKIREFKPGLYKLRVELETVDNIFLLEQDFRWGVLAVNTNKSIYLPGEKAYLQMAALNDEGTTICDAKLKLEIKNPNYEINTFSTEDGTIQYSDECGPKSVTYKPDYFSYFDVGEAGNYEMKLTNLDNGYEILDSFKVEETVPFEVERMSPTRIYPVAKYEMRIIIKAYEDFSGKIIEQVPASFEVIEAEQTPITTLNNVESASISVSNQRESASINIQDETKQIIWEVSWLAGETYELSYQFDASDISPYLYLLGPLIISDKQQEASFQEVRQWQIASDRTTWNEATCSSSGTYACYDDAMPSCTDTKCRNYGSYSCSKSCTARPNATASSTNCVLSPAGASSMPCTCAGASFCAGESGSCTVSTNRCDYTCSANWEDCSTTDPADGCECNLLTSTCVGTTCTPGGITISGNIYTDEGSTAYGCNADNLTVRVKVNGAGTYTGTCTLATGAYSVTGVTISAVNDVITVYLDGETPDAVAVTTAADTTSSITLFHLYQNRAIFRSEGTAITNTNLEQWDKDDDPDIFFDSDLSGTYNLTVDANNKIVVWTGDTFTPGGTVTTPSMELTGTYTASSFTLTLNSTGSGATCTAAAGTMMPFCINGGTFTYGTSTLTFTGATTATSIASTTYYNLNLGGAATTTTYTAAGNITVTNVLTIVSSSGTNTFDASSYTITLSGTGTPFVNNETFTASTSTIKYTGNGAVTIAALTYYNLQTGLDATLTADRTYTLGGDTTVTNVLTQGPNGGAYIGYLAGSSYTLTLSGTGTPWSMYSNGYFTADTSTVKYKGNGDTNIRHNLTGAYYNLEFSPAITVSNKTYTGAGAITAGGTLLIGPTSAASISLTFMLGGTTSVTGLTTIQGGNSATSLLDTKSAPGDYTFNTGSLDIYGGGTLNGRASALDSGGAVRIFLAGTLTSTSGNFNVAGSFGGVGTFTHSSGTVIFDGSGTQTISSGNSFYNVTLSNNTFTLSSYDMTVGGNLVISEGKTPTITATTSQAFTVTGTTDGTAGGGAETLTVNTTGAITFTGAVGTGQALMLTTLTITNSAALLFSSTINITGALTQTNAATGTTTFSNTVAVASATLKGVAFAVNNSFTAAAAGAVAVTNSGVFTLSATGAIVAPGGFSTSGAATIGNNITTTNTTLSIGGNLILSASAMPTLAAGSGAITITGTTDGTNGGAVETLAVNTTGAVTFTGAVGTGDADMLTALTITNSAALLFSSTINITGALTQTNAATGTTTFSSTVAAGSASLNGTTINLGGTTTVTGNLTIIEGTLDTILGGNHSLTIGSLTIQAGATLNGRASALDSNGDVTIEASGTLTSTSGNFNVGGSWSNSATGVFTHSSGTVIFDATTTGKTITDGGDAFYQIQFTGASGGWTYTDGCSAGLHQLTVNAASGTVNFINAKTGDGSHDLTVTTGTLNVDWYLGVHVADAANESDHRDTGASDITISEKTGTPASTVWRNDGTAPDYWGAAAASQTTGTDSDGNNPQPNSDGAILIREYSNTAGTPTYYLYNLQIVWQSTYGEYDYYSDYGSNYLTSTANSGANKDAVIGADWHRTTIGTMNAVGTINAAPTNGSWYIGMLKGLEVTIVGTSIDFGNLTVSNNFSATAGTQTEIRVTTSSVNGYIVTAWEDGLMACSDSGACASEKIPNFTFGTYANPQPWGATDYCKDNTNYCGFGFTSNDDLVESEDRYSPTPGTPEYTFFPISSSAPVRVSDNPGPIYYPNTGSSYLITYRISTSLVQRPGPYGSTIIYVVTAQY